VAYSEGHAVVERYSSYFVVNSFVGSLWSMDTS